jgi:MinD-like ATPase involved in chromosome partitioning or flagellar assembly
METVAIVGSKAGIGTTTVAAALAVVCAERGGRVLAVDTRPGLGSLHQALGVHPVPLLADVVRERERLAGAFSATRRAWCVAVCGQRAPQLGIDVQLRLIGEVQAIAPDFDLMIVDAGVGATELSGFFSRAAQRVAIVVAPGDEARRASLQLLLHIARRRPKASVHVIVNHSRSNLEGVRAFAELADLAHPRLCVDLSYCGAIPEVGRGRAQEADRRVLLDETKLRDAAGEGARRIAPSRSTHHRQSGEWPCLYAP